VLFKKTLREVSELFLIITNHSITCPIKLHDKMTFSHTRENILLINPICNIKYIE